MNLLSYLQDWFVSQCNEDWEHGEGIRLETLDNPGWSLSIDLDNTDLEDRSFAKIDRLRSEDDWLFCWVKDRVFVCYCGPRNLEEAIEEFRRFSESPSDTGTAGNS